MKKLIRLALVALSITSVPVIAHYTKSAPAQQEIVSETAELDALLELMSERLDLMSDISTWKWNNTVPIDEPDKETALLDTLSPEARTFMQAQIEAGKLAQIHAFEQWVVDDAPIKPGSVKSPEGALAALDKKLIAQYERTQPLFQEGDLATLVEARAQALFHHTDRAERDTALAPLFAK